MWAYDYFQFIFSIKVFCQTPKISITRNDNSFIVIGILNHAVEYELRIHISFAFSIHTSDCRFEDKRIAIILKRPVEIGIGGEIADKKKRFAYMIFVF